MTVPPAAELPINPRTATNLVEFRELLVRLRASKNSPSFNQMERDAGPGNLSHAMAHRLVSPTYDLTKIRDCDRVVATFVTTLGENPGPWSEVAERLLWEAANPLSPRLAVPDDGPQRRPSRRSKVLLGAGAFAIVAVVAAVILIPSTPAVTVQAHLDQPVAIEIGTEEVLSVAVEDNTARLGAGAVVRATSGTGIATWLVTAPHRDNRNYRQLRHFDGDPELVCLEVRDKSLADDAPVQFNGCNGETHQYWSLQPTESGYLRVVNLNSGKCVSVAGAGQPQSGMHVIQRPCDDNRAAQQWKTTVTAAPQQAKRQFAGSLNPAELPHGGQDKPCAGLPTLDVDTTPWTTKKESVRQSFGPRGYAAIRPSAAYTELFFANTIDPATSTEETYYWVEGWTKFTPERFRLYLQWTTVRGPGGWHTCEYELPEQGTVKSVAVPRDSAPDKARDVQFRTCVSYQPILGDRILECSTDRY